MTKSIYYKNTPAQLLENDFLRVIVLPSIGGKIASIFHKATGFEVLEQNQKADYKEAEWGDDFSLFDTSGFDDCFPSINQSMEMYDGKEVLYPDHGDLWSGRFDYKMTGHRMLLSYTREDLPYTFAKELSLEDGMLHIHYKITNNGSHPLEGFFTPHCLIRCEQDMTLLFPQEAAEVINVINSTVLGTPGKTYSYPVAQLKNGTSYSLDKIQPRSAEKYEKYYVTDKITSGSCGAYYPSVNMLFQMHYDPEVFPYFGFWVTEGGFKGAYNCALEPSTGFYDSMTIAREHLAFNTIAPGATMAFNLDLSLENKKKPDTQCIRPSLHGQSA